MIKICTDSCCDLNAKQIEENKIGVLPLFVTLEDKDYLDGVDITPKQIFDFVGRTNQLPKTAARSIEDYKDFFSNALKEADEVFFTGISSELSSSYRNACVARDEMNAENIYIVDSKSLSTGIGNLILYACSLAKQGVPCKEIASIIEKQTQYNQTSFVVDKLDYLYKGGRCSAMARLGASMLRIKPRLELVDGKILNTGKYMGPYKKVVLKYIDDMLTTHTNFKKEMCFITHTCTDENFVNEIVEYVKSKNLFDEVIPTVAGATITSHCGENTLGILYLLEG